MNEDMTSLLSLLFISSFLILTSSASVAVSRPSDFKANCQLSSDGGCECRVVEGSDGETLVRYDTLDPCRMSVEMQTAENKKKLNKEIEEKFGAFKDNCFPKPSGGCKCNVDEGQGEVVREYKDDADCKKSIEAETAENKKKLNEEIKEKFGDFKDNCFPKPSGGCRCNVDEGQGEEVKEYKDDADCKKSIEDETRENKKKLNEEIAEKFGGFKENCFPKPSGGCKCNEKDGEGNEVVATYDDVTKCEAVVRIPSRRFKRAERPSQNVRDPVREQAQANYAKVLDELRDKFKGLKEGCFPRPKGCLCIVGKTPEGRDITERRMKDVDCKCQAGEKGPGCPAA